MLYVTTRSSRDAFTAPYTLRESRGADGGFYLPFRFPEFDEVFLNSLSGRSFGECVADILNLFFTCRLTGTDVDFTIGRTACRLVSVSHRLIVAETWHNQQWDVDWTIRRLAAKIRGDDDYNKKPADWLCIAIRIAMLFGIYAQMRGNGMLQPGENIDVSVASGDFSAPMAVWYARKMGLPVNTVICAANENSGIWDLFYHGQMHTDSIAIATSTPEGDHTVPPALERLISAVLGYEELERYLDICRRGRLYTVTDEQTELLRDGIFTAVIRRSRMAGIIASVKRTNGYLLDPYGALACGGVQDYRVKTGAARTIVLLSDKSPSRSCGIVAEALGVSEAEIQGQFRIK